MEIKTVKGFKDIFGIDAQIFEEIEKVTSSVASSFGYKFIVLPTVEYAELFDRTIGDATDIVEKEMFKFTDKGERTLALRPEMTASVARSFIEHHFETQPSPFKVYYFGPCYRYENPQKGRYREFYQFGIEALGDISPVLDAEVINVAIKIVERFDIKNLKVKLNSIGCRVCRPNYKKALIEALEPHYNELCEDCKRRLYTNPMRVLDCKKESQELKNNLPKISDYLCDECKNHFKELKTLLQQLDIPFEIDNTLVRGLDYYSKTVFEVISEDLGAQNALLGGGRYDYLVEDLGGRKTPGVGFAMGIERLMEILKKSNYKLQSVGNVYIVYDRNFIQTAYEIANKLRELNYIVEIDHKGDGIKKQIERASKRGANASVIIGEEEAKKQTVIVKNMKSGEQVEMNKNAIVEAIREAINNA